MAAVKQVKDGVAQGGVRILKGLARPYLPKASLDERKGRF